jgi:hypothetical protein
MCRARLDHQSALYIDYRWPGVQNFGLRGDALCQPLSHFPLPENVRVKRSRRLNELTDLRFRRDKKASRSDSAPYAEFGSRCQTSAKVDVTPRPRLPPLGRRPADGRIPKIGPVPLLLSPAEVTVYRQLGF